MSLFGRLIQVNLRTRFVLPISAMVVVSMLITSGYLLKRQDDGFRRELETSGKTMIQMLAMNAESGVLFESTHELEDLLQVLAPFETVEFAIVINLAGDVLSRTGNCAISPTVWKVRDLAGDQQVETAKSYVTDSSGQGILILTAPVLTQRERISRENLGITSGLDKSIPYSYEPELIGYIALGLSEESVNRSIAEGRIVVIVLALLIVLTSIILVTFIVSAITNPVTELVKVTDQISHGDLSRKVEINRNDEIGHLAKTFNKMIESLKQSRDEIEQYNRTLEEKIIERTRQLEEAQAQLIQSEKMGAIGQLAAGVAHELNNPLGGILGYAQFTLEKLSKNVPEKTTTKDIASYVKYVSDIEAQARRCKTIVQNLLKFSRSSRTVDFEEIEVNRAIEETISFVEHQLRINQVELIVSLTPGIPTIQGNIGQLQQVFTNLIINAMHASEKGTAIEIVSRYSPAVGEFGGAVELLFIDHGHGVSAENLKKIFEPFFTTKEVGKGTGLGLSVSYGIIRDHGGEILVKSEVSEGTTFTVVLPVQRSPRSSDTVRESETSLRG
ncbi:MAG TPA: ATP-binding protein [Acidobacteriota bacterium]|nr:ATP-binding protein [Acidobacteriota bacterium]